MLHQSENSDGNELMEKLSNAGSPSRSFPVMRRVHVLLGWVFMCDQNLKGTLLPKIKYL